jgi:hypothetical protein
MLMDSQKCQYRHIPDPLSELSQPLHIGNWR